MSFLTISLICKVTLFLSLVPANQVTSTLICFFSPYLSCRALKGTPRVGPKAPGQCSIIITPNGLTWVSQSTPCLFSLSSAGRQLPRRLTWDLCLSTAGSNAASHCLYTQTFMHLKTKVRQKHFAYICMRKRQQFNWKKKIMLQSFSAFRHRCYTVSEWSCYRLHLLFISSHCYHSSIHKQRRCACCFSCQLCLRPFYCKAEEEITGNCLPTVTSGDVHKALCHHQHCYCP